MHHKAAYTALSVGQKMCEVAESIFYDSSQPGPRMLVCCLNMHDQIQIIPGDLVPQPNLVLASGLIEPFNRWTAAHVLEMVDPNSEDYQSFCSAFSMKGIVAAALTVEAWSNVDGQIIGPMINQMRLDTYDVKKIRQVLTIVMGFDGELQYAQAQIHNSSRILLESLHFSGIGTTFNQTWMVH